MPHGCQMTDVRRIFWMFMENNKVQAHLAEVSPAVFHKK